MDEEDATTAAATASSADNSPSRARRRGVGGGSARGNRLARGLATCNCASYCYFSLALVLFSLGTVLTILVLDDSEQMFPNLTHMWLIGPIFISSGLMFAVKTIMYLRRETMIAYLARQHSLLRVSICVTNRTGSPNCLFRRRFVYTLLTFRSRAWL